MSSPSKAPSLKVVLPTLAGALATLVAALAQHKVINPADVSLAGLTVCQAVLGYLAPHKPVRVRLPKRKPKPKPAPAPKFTTLFDSTNLRNLPRIASTSTDVVAAYDDGLYDNVAQARKLYPGHRHLFICVRESDAGDVIDSEPGNVISGSDPVARAVATVNWIEARHRAGQRFIGCYADRSDWALIAAEMGSRRLDHRPLIDGGLVFKFLADPTGHPHIPDGFDCCQYLWTHDYDESLAYTASLRLLPRH